KKAVKKGLLWLALHQGPDGNWSLDKYQTFARANLDETRYVTEKLTGQGQNNDVAATAFGLLPFLLEGISHKESKDPENQPYVKSVAAGISYLIRKQEKDGSFPGGMYAHGLATQAMCFTSRLTQDPKVKASAQAAVNYIVSAQDPQSGGWRYSPR